MADWCPICRQISEICDVFGLTAADIRPGSIPQLQRAAREWRTAGYPDPRPRLHDLVLRGRSLWEVLTAGRVDLDAIDFIGSGLMMGTLPDCRRGALAEIVNEIAQYYKGLEYCHCDCEMAYDKHGDPIDFEKVPHDEECMWRLINFLKRLERIAKSGMMMDTLPDCRKEDEKNG